MTGTRRVVLRNLRDQAGTRYLSAALGPDGLEIFGADRGPGVSSIWGESAYEWEYRIAAADVPALVAALAAVLGAGAGDDVLELLQRLYREPSGRAIEDFIGPGLVPASFYSRIGD